MLILVVRVTIKAGHENEVLVPFRKLQEETRREPGCILYVVQRSCEDSRRYNAPELREHHQILNEDKSDETVPPPWLPDTQKMLIVGGVAGLIILGLAYLQIREFRRRRQGTSVSKGC